MKDTKKIELYSDEVRDILTRPPRMLIRSGISVICGIIILIFIGCCFFKYPDVVSGNIVITTENPPVWLFSKATGKIKELYCSDKQFVNQGQLLAIIDNSIMTSDIEALKRDLALCVISDTALNLTQDFFIRTYELGDIQPIYSSFVRAATDYNNFISLNLIKEEKNALCIQVSKHKNYSSNLQKQLDLKKKELIIARSIYEREKNLQQNGILAKADLEMAEKSFLDVQQSLQQLQTTIASDGIETAKLDETMSRLNIQYSKEKNNMLIELKSLYSELLSSIEKWEKAYLLTAPTDGIVSFNTFWATNQFVNVGDKVFAIIPQNSGSIIGRMNILSSGSGKVKEGQRVNIKVDGYPYMEYGFLRGEVQSISLVANENKYLIGFKLTQGLKTTNGKTLDFKGELAGQAEIVTEDLSLIQRIFAPLKYLIINHVAN